MSFIDFLRPPGASRKNDLQSLLEERRVVVSPLIRLELLQGVRSSDRKQLSTLLDALPSLQVQPELFETAEILLPTTRKQGLLTGLIDYLLVIQALLADVSLYTFRQNSQASSPRLGSTSLFLTTKAIK